MKERSEHMTDTEKIDLILDNVTRRQEGKESANDNILKKGLKAFNSSTPIMILNTATTIGNLVSLILGSEIIFGELSVDQKFAREVAIFTIIGLLLASWGAVGCHQLWRKFKEPPPDSNVSNASMEKDKPLVVPCMS